MSKFRSEVVGMLIALVCVALIGSMAQAYPTATKLWNYKVTDPRTIGSLINCVAVDSRLDAHSEIYCPDTINHTVLKISEDGVKLKSFGPTVENAGATDSFTLSGDSFRGCYPLGMAVDPKTGYVYLNCTKNGAEYIEVVDASAPGDGAVLIRDFSSGALVSTALSFSNDGSKLYAAGYYNDHYAVAEFVRNNNSTPSDFTDDFFVGNGLEYKDIGPLGADWQLMSSCAVDSLGRVYATDLDWTTNNLPIRRYNSDGTINLEFWASRKSSAYGSCVDGRDYFWVCMGDQGSRYSLECYHDGVPVCHFSLTDSLGGVIPYPEAVCWDKRNDRLIAVGDGLDVNPGYFGWLCSYQLADMTTTNPGRVEGRVVDGSGNPVTTVDSINVFTTYRGVDGQPYFNNFFIAAPVVGSDGRFSIEVPEGLMNIQAQAPDYLPTTTTHWQVVANATIGVGDIVLLPKTSDYVKATFGEHNVEQGLQMINLDSGKTQSTATTMGGKACRSWATPGQPLQGNLSFGISGIFSDYLPQLSTFCMEQEYFDVGPSRFGVSIGASQFLGWCMEYGTSSWKTSKWYRSNVNLATGDLTLTSSDVPSGPPATTQYLASLTVRKTVSADSFETVGSIADLKTKFPVRGITGSAANGRALMLVGKTVVGSWPGCFYIEEDNRASGIRVVSAANPAVGSIVTVKGTVSFVPGTDELCFNAYDVAVNGTNPNPPGALGVNGKSIGCGALMLPWGSSAILQEPGVADQFGLNRIGLLSRTSGLVTYAGGDYVYIDDGSKVQGGRIESPASSFCWQYEVAKPEGAMSRALAIDQTNGDIYVPSTLNHEVYKIDKNGNLLMIIGQGASRVFNAAGTNYFSYMGSDPQGLAVDPLTGWVYGPMYDHYIEAFDTSTGVAVQKDVVEFATKDAAGNNVFGKSLCFSDDGMKMYVADGASRVIEYARQNHGTPVYTDDTWVPSGVEFSTSGMTSIWGVTVDRVGAVYAMSFNTNSPVWKFNPDGTLNMTIPRNSISYAITGACDAYNNLWLGDVGTNAKFNSYHNGTSVFTIDSSDHTPGAAILCVDFDRARNRVVMLTEDQTGGVWQNNMLSYAVVGGDVSLPSSIASVGVKVVAPSGVSLPDVGAYITATGVVSLDHYVKPDPSGFDYYYPTLLLRDSTDIVPR